MATTAEALRTDTRSRILDAAVRAATTFGLSRLTMEDVAREADLSRQSVYRYFESKDALVMAAVVREEEAFIDGVRAAHVEHEDLEEAMEQAFLFCLRAAREHPLLDRLLATEPEVLLPYLTTRAGPLVTRARAVLKDLVGSRAVARHELIHRAADLGVRAMISYTITPSDDPPEVVARELARIMAAALGPASKGPRPRPQEATR